jgi:hypothetical protein
VLQAVSALLACCQYLYPQLSNVQEPPISNHLRGCVAGGQEAPAAAYPALGDMLTFAAARHARLAARADAAEALALPPGAMSALIGFLRTCRKQRAAAGQPTSDADFEAFTGPCSTLWSARVCSAGAGGMSCAMASAPLRRSCAALKRVRWLQSPAFQPAFTARVKPPTPRLAACVISLHSCP